MFCEYMLATTCLCSSCCEYIWYMVVVVYVVRYTPYVPVHRAYVYPYVVNLNMKIQYI
jgi:hypothetical protein